MNKHVHIKYANMPRNTGAHKYPTLLLSEDNKEIFNKSVGSTSFLAVQPSCTVILQFEKV